LSRMGAGYKVDQDRLDQVHQALLRANLRPFDRPQMAR